MSHQCLKTTIVTVTNLSEDNTMPEDEVQYRFKTVINVMRMSEDNTMQIKAYTHPIEYVSTDPPYGAPVQTSKLSPVCRGSLAPFMFSAR